MLRESRHGYLLIFGGRYAHTAYFLEWCEGKFGEGFVRRLNGSLKDKDYSPQIWKDLSDGATVEQLWQRYKLDNGLGMDGNDSETEGEGEEEGHDTNAKGAEICESSEGESVDVVGREEANEDLQLSDGNDDGKFDPSSEWAADEWLPEEKEALFLRHRLQKTFLSAGQKPQVDVRD